MYVTRKKQLRKRKMDPSVAVLNRMFLVEDGARSLIDDTLRQTKYHDAGQAPDFRNISKFVFTSNPYFTRLWGFIPIGVMNSDPIARPTPSPATPDRTLATRAPTTM